MPRRTGRCVAGPAEYGESWIARSQISSRCKPPSTGKTSEPVPCPALVSHICRRNLRGAGRCPVRAFKEMSWPPTFRSTRTTRTNVGSPTGRESYGDGGLVVVAGVTTCQGGRESRPQGEADQAIGHHLRKVGVMPSAEPEHDVLRGLGGCTLTRDGRWRARCWEIWHGGFGPGAAGKGPDHRYLASGLPVPHVMTLVGPFRRVRYGAQNACKPAAGFEPGGVVPAPV